MDASPPFLAEDNSATWDSQSRDPRGRDVQLDALGVINALERTCSLESSLRQAIRSTHPISTSLDWDFETADRERLALLAIMCGGSQAGGMGTVHTAVLKATNTSCSTCSISLQC